MNKRTLHKNLDSVMKLAEVSKIKRLLSVPFKYVNAILYRELVYKRTKRSKEVISDTFFDTKMSLLLPASTDIYLTKGKSHDSEIRLARFIINNLDSGDTFIDVGAHYGYFTQLASVLVGKNGQVHSYEASPSTFLTLQKNTKSDNIKINNLAISDSNEILEFYTFPNIYSEYSTMEIDQFKNEKWFNEYKPTKSDIQGVLLQDEFLKHDVTPKIVKIDVEGAELKVIKGIVKYIEDNEVLIVLEYLSNERGNTPHIEAQSILAQYDYKPYLISKDGHLAEITNIPAYLEENNLESDNIVFKKS